MHYMIHKIIIFEIRLKHVHLPLNTTSFYNFPVKMRKCLTEKMKFENFENLFISQKRTNPYAFLFVLRKIPFRKISTKPVSI